MSSPSQAVDATHALLLKQRRRGKTLMLWGAGLFIVGALITIVTFANAAPSGGTYIISWGPMVFGVLRFCIGLNTFSKAEKQLTKYAPQANFTQPYGATTGQQIAQATPQVPQQSAPAGWHPDPARRHELRYWDGATWTGHVLNNGIAAYDPA